MSNHLPGDFQKVVYRLLEDINTPRSLAVAICIRSGSLRQAVSFHCDPEHYIDPEDYARDVMATDFLRKCNIPGVSEPDLLESECLERLMGTERACFQTNKRLSRFLDGLLDQPGDARILKFFQDVKEIIRYIVGPIPHDLTSCGFGPGATLTNSSRLSTIPDKIESVPCGTDRALYLFDTLFPESAWDRYGGSTLRVRERVRGNRFFTVKKTALTYRGAALSPNVNGFLQRGVGVYLRSRLKRANIHISGQPLAGNLFSVNDYTSSDVHRRLAREASKSDAYSTIDLTDASNTIARKLIELTWPTQWVDLLCDLREPFMTLPDGKTWWLQMFSAMGNGFTFELETITFYAIAKAAGATFVSVFGDDIIVDRDSANDVLAALKFCGFTPNKRKTFTSGPFRESCGGDFYDGVPVRAHYVKEIPSAAEHWISLANGLRRFAGDPSTSHRWTYVRRAWWGALDALPRHLRGLRGPSDLGDLVLHDNSALPGKVRNGISYWRCYAPVGEYLKLHHWKPNVVFASALYGIPSRGVLSRGAVSGYRVKWVPFS